MRDSSTENEREDSALTAAQDAVESSVLRENLLAERKAASTANFGLGVVSILLLVGLIAGGVWYFSSQNTVNMVASAGGMSGIAAASTSTTKSSDVSPPSKTPTTIHVLPAPGKP